MKKQLLTSIFLIVLTLQFAKAEEINDVTIIKKETVKEGVVEDSSEFNRIGKKYSIYSESAGGALSVGTLGIAYLLNRKEQILVNFSGYSLPVSDSIFNGIFGIREKVKGSGVGVNYKYFLGNSFFIRGGADYRQLSYERSYQGGIFGLSSTNDDNSSFSGSSTSLVVGIGNDWAWKHFTLGFDWIRLHTPIGHQIDSTKISSNESQQVINSRKESYLTKASAFM